MFEEEINTTPLPMRALDEIPNPSPNAEHITALVKEKGRVVGYQLSGGRIVTKEEGVNLAKNGNIRGVGIANRKGEQYLKSLPDGTENNNLGNLPSISR